MFLDQVEKALSLAGRRKRAAHIPLYIFYVFAIPVWSWISAPNPFANNTYVLIPQFAGILILFWLLLVNHVRRLHDLGHSGVWVVLICIPIVNLILLTYLIFFKGQNGGNRYGPDPITGSYEIEYKYDKASELSQIKEENFLNADPEEALQKYKSKLGKK